MPVARHRRDRRVAALHEALESGRASWAEASGRPDITVALRGWPGHARVRWAPGIRWRRQEWLDVLGVPPPTALVLALTPNTIAIWNIDVRMRRHRTEPTLVAEVPRSGVTARLRLESASRLELSFPSGGILRFGCGPGAPGHVSAMAIVEFLNKRSTDESGALY